MMWRPELLQLPNVPKPLHGVNPRSILGKNWWDKTRSAAYGKFDFCCHACGIHLLDAKYHRWLEGHEVYDTQYDKGRLIYLETVALCHSCHNYIHSGRLEMLLRSGEITKEKYLDIIQHGENILKANGLKPVEPYHGPMAKWGDWRLVLEEKFYSPIYKTFAEWEQAYSKSSEE